MVTAGSSASVQTASSSSVRQVAGQHKLGLTLTSIILLVLVAAAAFGVYSYLSRKKSAAFESFATVSYTHLDVYKRQVTLAAGTAAAELGTEAPSVTGTDSVPAILILPLRDVAPPGWVSSYHARATQWIALPHGMDCNSELGSRSVSDEPLISPGEE